MAALALLPLLGSCAPVKPYQREHLSERCMAAGFGDLLEPAVPRSLGGFATRQRGWLHHGRWRVRLQLGSHRTPLSRALSALLLFVSLWAGAARAEQIPQNPSGEVSFRGNYWRDRNTRVLNPSVDVRQDLPSGVSLQGHYLLDAITSASVASGAAADMPFTEMRHEAGVNVAVPLGRAASTSCRAAIATRPRVTTSRTRPGCA